MAAATCPSDGYIISVDMFEVMQWASFSMRLAGLTTAGEKGAKNSEGEVGVI